MTRRREACVPIVGIGDKDAMVSCQAFRRLLGGVGGDVLEVGDLGGLAGCGGERLFYGADGGGHGVEWRGTEKYRRETWRTYGIYSRCGAGRQQRTEERTHLESTSLADHSDGVCARFGRQVRSRPIEEPLPLLHPAFHRSSHHLRSSLLAAARHPSPGGSTEAIA